MKTETQPTQTFVEKAKHRLLEANAKKAVEMTGRKYGRLVVVSRAGSTKDGSATWECLCECGNKVVVVGKNLRNALTFSCGCLQRDRTAHVSTTHGESHNAETKKKPSPEYTTWCSMKDRCYNPRNSHYNYYGGRGIKVCARWLRSFESFLADMGRRTSNKHSIDRFPNNNGDYSPENCRWATVKEQNSNRRKRKDSRT